MPPLQALAALHGLWLMLFIPPTVIWGGRTLTPGKLRQLALCFWFLALGAAAVIVGHTFLYWASEAPQMRLPFVWHRLAFVLATLGDETFHQLMPIIELTLAGWVSWRLARSDVTGSAVQDENALTDSTSTTGGQS